MLGFFMVDQNGPFCYTIEIVNKKERQMSKLLITTQIFENYAWDEDGVLGTGVNAYWKAKGGNDYVLKNFQDFDRITEVVMALRDKIEAANDAWMEHIVDWTVVEDDYLTEFERSQLEYEGKITYPAIEVSFG